MVSWLAGYCHKSEEFSDVFLILQVEHGLYDDLIFYIITK